MARLRTLVSVFLLAGLAAGLAFPKVAFACSCAVDPSSMHSVDDASAVMVGRVGRDRGDGTFEFAVERWFRGDGAAVVALRSAAQPMGDGSFSYNTCGLDLKAGQHLVIAASRDGAAYLPSSCSPHADVDTDVGRQMISDAQGRFGPGFAPGTAPPEGIDLSIFVLPGLAVAAFAVVLLVAFVRRPRA